jgi:hypothetical protein
MESAPREGQGTSLWFTSFLAIAMSRATTTSQRNAIGTKEFSGNFQDLKAPATLARGLVEMVDWFGFHGFGKWPHGRSSL